MLPIDVFVAEERMKNELAERHRQAERARFVRLARQARADRQPARGPSRGVVGQLVRRVALLLLGTRS